MITLLAHRLCDSICDDLTLGGEVTEQLLHLPELAQVDLLVEALHGVLEDVDLADWLVRVLLPDAVYVLHQAMPTSPFQYAAVDLSGGRQSPHHAVARTECRALLAAAFRAYDHMTSVRSSISAADNTNAPASLFLVAGAAE